jgi:putative two-component system response regulator
MNAMTSETKRPAAGVGLAESNSASSNSAAIAAEVEAANRQLFRVVDDLKMVIHQRNQAQQQVAENHFEMMYLQVLGADFRAGRNGLRLLRIGVTAEILARKAGMPDAYCALIRRAAPVHDIGMSAMPDALLRKREDLSDEEWRQWQEHTEIGARILSSSIETPLTRMAAEVALSHHENFQGRGYPAGLAGEAIPFSGRIVALAEYYETHTNPLGRQRQALPPGALLVSIRALRGRRFDPALVDLFIEHFETISAAHRELDSKADSFQALAANSKSVPQPT